MTDFQTAMLCSVDSAPADRSRNLKVSAPASLDILCSRILVVSGRMKFQFQFQFGVRRSLASPTKNQFKFLARAVNKC